MIGTERILAALRLRRLAIGMLLVPLLVLNLVAASLGTSHMARASAFDDVVARSRCLTGTDAMLPGKAPVKSEKHQPCPACATACTTGCCAGPALLGAGMSASERRLAASLNATHMPITYLAVPLQFRSSLHAQAPPLRQRGQSFDA
ncbi:hypothetical protein [Dongia rigui]|uniref:DUF2946 domain-containing protein n=1 Tax=Dongia rigui TaxID=940149 RepID=A0ABU5E0T7_9PROT|nr:hypothetical protein [Dongia rigui]MDY0873203.1 hypothetical protein [Dongia rigui]